jgi:cytochrome c5
MPISTRQLSRLITLTPVLALLLMFATGCSEKESSEPAETAAPETAAPAPQAAQPEPAPAPAPEPVAEPAGTDMADADTGEAAAPDGKAVYDKICVSCHAAGIANAPKLGDQDAWAPRIAKGEEALFQSVRNGLNAMPAKGACPSCSDAELRAAVAYMVGESS